MPKVQTTNQTMQANPMSDSKSPLSRMGVRSAVYARYSSDMQSQDSADDQIARIQYRIEQGQIRSQKFFGRTIDLSKEWTVKDEAQSGRLAGRDGYEKIITGLRNKSFDILIVDDLSRLTRSLGNLLGLYDMLKWYEVELISICDGISSEDPSAKTFFTVKGMVNDFSNDIHAERVIRGMEMRVLQGLSCGDYPFGYDSNPTKFENAKGKPFPSHYKVTINENEAQNIRRIFQLYNAGLGFSRIAKALNSEKIPSPGMAYAKPGTHPVWSPTGIRHILQNEKYIGIWRWKKTKNGIHPETKLRSAKDRPTTDWVSHLAGKEMREDLRIIEQDLWETVQKIFTESKQSPYTLRSKARWQNKGNILPEHPFSGLMECGVCSANFQLVGGKKGGYYGCVGAHKSGSCTNRLSIGIKRVEGALVALLKEKLLTPEIVEFAVKNYNRALETRLSIAPERLEQVEKELGHLEAELQNLIQVIITGNASETVNYAIKEREQGKVRLMSERASLRRTSVKTPKIKVDEIKARFEFLAEAIVERPMDCFPVIRTFFPKKVRLIPMGKAGSDGQSLYSMNGEVSLNGVMAQGFNRIISSNKKGEAVNPSPRSSSVALSTFRDPRYQGFSMCENGVLSFTTTGISQPHDIINLPLLTDQGITSEIVDLYRSELGISQISKRLKIARSTVRDKLTKAGISFAESSGNPNPSSKRNSSKPRWNSPYGFIYTAGKLAPHPQEFETLKLILQWSKAGHKHQAVANKLNARKFRPRSAKQWDRFTVRQIVLWHAERPKVLPEIFKRTSHKSTSELNPDV